MTEETNLTGLVTIFSNLEKAALDEMRRRGKALQDAKKVQAMMPKNPKRGSFYWWAKLCRQYTGAHFLDSGGAYGYQYQKPAPPKDAHISFEIRDGKLDTCSIDLPHYLESNFDADNETSRAIEKVLFWFGEWGLPREDWGSIAEDLGDCLQWLYDCFDNRKEQRFIKSNLGRLMYDNIGTGYTEMSYDQRREMTTEQFIDAAVKDFPVAAIRHCFERRVVATKDERAFYTYNSDNNLDQDFMVVAWLKDDDNDFHAIVRTHNGCDARGGYSSPVVAMCRDRDYLTDWQVKFSCPNCEEDYPSIYYYDRALDRGGSIFVFPMASWIEFFTAKVQIDAGQEMLPGIKPPAWEWAYTQEEAMAIMKWYESAGVDANPPLSLLANADTVYPPPHDETHYCIDDEIHGFYCPECGMYSVYPYSGSVSGR